MLEVKRIGLRMSFIISDEIENNRKPDYMHPDSVYLKCICLMEFIFSMEIAVIVMTLPACTVPHEMGLKSFGGLQRMIPSCH
jgi:hypothetical protein